ncbi:MAG TPA: sigma 54-interacting transcriptional regulator, partial [Pyrinomonadaceae bacterium]|nr:sigma 54-interacting transcriptional regulator [Pyrinomonadaceae bacterium]
MTQKTAAITAHESRPLATHVAPAREPGGAEHLADLLEIARTLAETRDLKTALARALDSIGSRPDVTRAFVMLREREGVELRVAAVFGVGEEEARRVTYRLGEGITGRVAKTGKTVVVPQVSREPLFLDRLAPRRKSNGREESSFVCVPVLLNRQPLGVVGVSFRYRPERDFERVTRFLSIVASMVAQAVKVEHLYESDKQRLLDENTHLKQELRERYDFSHIVGNSGPLRQVYEQITQVARTNTTVLLRGESGTGKELIAHAIHYNSLRASKPFVKVSCAALPETLIESELFGYERGAFTGAQGRKKG